MDQGRWEEMQMDCLVNIFSRLGLDDLTAAVPFVCRSWYQASGDPLGLRTLDFRHLDFNPSSPFAERISPQFSFSGFLKLVLARARGASFDLSFPSSVSPSNEDLYLASDECPRLKNLSLSRIKSEDETQFLQSIAKWKDLEVLEMDSKPSILPELVQQIGLNCSKFHGLKLRGSINKEDAAAIVGNLPNLRWLDLSTCRLRREEVIAIVEGCRQLKRLNLRDCVGFEADEEVRRRGSWIKVFEHEGSMIEDECEDFDLEDDDREVSLEEMLMYYDDCYAMWLY
ncbi:F-box protein SKIP1 [Platanthera guangdongensis]|uniref:F-box protein SKIP1 n=1 Tax=Platanthera guangdongensis TaxID=2320717 RepID=A0ABR2LV05_9ASPA